MSIFYCVRCDEIRDSDFVGYHVTAKGEYCDGCFIEGAGQ